MALEQEREYFERVRGDLLDHHQGKYALVYNSELIGVWDSRESAYDNGIERFGNVSFLIKRIVEEDPVENVPLIFIGGA